MVLLLHEHYKIYTSYKSAGTAAGYLQPVLRREFGGSGVLAPADEGFRKHQEEFLIHDEGLTGASVTERTAATAKGRFSGRYCSSLI